MKSLRIFSLFLAALCAACTDAFRRPLGAFRTANAETQAGTHKHLHRTSDAAFPYTHLLVKSGTDELHGNVAGAADYPIGTTTDAPDAAGEEFNLLPLAASERTRRMRCATALTADTPLYSAAAGNVQGVPGVAGTYFRVGHSVYAAEEDSDGGGYIIEVSTHAPIKTIVIAAATSAQNATAAAVDLASSEALANALKASYNALQADYAALSAALQAGPCEIIQL